MGLKPIGPPDSKLWFGTGIHYALERWYMPRKVKSTETGAVRRNGFKRSIHPVESWNKFIGDEISWIKANYRHAEGEVFENDYIEARELGEIMLGEYLKTYGNDDAWEFLGVERAGQVVITTPSGRPIVIYGYKFDGCYRNHAEQIPRIELLETKTAAQISTKHLPIDDQAGSYCTITTSELRNSDLIGPKEVIAGINYNFLRKATPDKRPKDEFGRSLNQNGSVSKQQPARNLLREFVDRTPREQRNQLRRIAAEAAVMEQFRSGDLELYKNGTKDCSWDCVFFEMCQLHEADAGWEDFRDMMFKQMDPYADHRG